MFLDREIIYFKLVNAHRSPFSVSLCNDTVHMKYKWDREINVYAIAINRYIEDELLELVPEISNLPPSRQGVSLTRTVPEIDKTVWKLGFDLIFYPNTPDMPTYGWKFRHGKFKKFIYGRNE